MPKRYRLIAAALLITIMPLNPARAKQPVVGEPVPPIELTLLDGSKVSVASMRGQVVVLNFWATWCVPCRTELPLLDAFYRKLQPRGLHVFAVTTEDSVPMYQLKKVFAAMAIPSVRRVKGMSTEMTAVPTSYIIDRAGMVRYAKAGALELDDLNREIVPLLNERPPA